MDMERCEVCGNDYDKVLHMRQNGVEHVFDSFECAIHALAPRCAHCDCRIIGHGMEANGNFYCCRMCAESEGQHAMRDRAEPGEIVSIESASERASLPRPTAVQGTPAAEAAAVEDDLAEEHDEEVSKERGSYLRTDRAGGNHPVGMPLGASAGAAMGAVAGLAGGPLGVVAGSVAGGVIGGMAGHAKLDRMRVAPGKSNKKKGAPLAPEAKARAPRMR